MADLEMIYRTSLQRAAPERLVGGMVAPGLPANVVAIGKSAGALFDGVASSMHVDASLVVIPRGYREPSAKSTLLLHGGHPQIDDASFAAGRELVRFVDDHDDILFLISGGGSACVELPLEPWFDERDLIDVNARLIAAGIAIGEINCVRKHLSAIKGGRLAARVRGRAETLIYSDVATGDLASVASGPTLPDTTTKQEAMGILRRVGGCDRIVTILGDSSLPGTVHHIDNSSARLIADNRTLTALAARVAEEQGLRPIMLETQVEGDVAAVARDLATRSRELQRGELLIAGGEPTVVVRGDGRGGRCSELAVRFVLAAAEAEVPPVDALFGSSDGIDGNSGVAGVLVRTDPPSFDPASATASLERSDSFPAAERTGRAVIIPSAGNNLRDLYLVARR